MAHFAEVTGPEGSQVVTRVTPLANDVITVDGVEDESLGAAFLSDLLGGTWVQCSYNSNAVAGEDRGLYPAVGFTWDGSNFAAPPAP